MTRTSSNLIVGVAFEGIGNIFGDGTNGLPLQSMFTSPLGGWEQFEGLQLNSNIVIDVKKFEQRPYLASNLSTVEVVCEPFNSTMRFSSLSIELEAENIIAELLQHKGRRADSTVSEELSFDAQQIQTEATDGGLTDTIVYINDETMLIDSHLGSGVYGLGERGLFGSIASHHPVDSNIFTTVPFWHGRGVRIYTLDPSHQPHRWQCRWQGRIDQNISTSADGTRIKFSAREGLATLDQTFLNLQQRKIDTQSVNFVSRSEDREQYEAKGSVGFNSAVKKTPGRGGNYWVQIQNGLYRVQGYRKQKFIKSRELQSPPEDSRPTSSISVHEVFVVHQNESWCSTSRLNEQPSFYSGVSILDKTIYPRHPLAIFAALCFSDVSDDNDPSTFNVLKAPYFSAQLKWLFDDDIIKNIHQMIQETQDLQVDNFVLGWSGEVVNMYEDIVRPLLHAYGFYFGMNNSGFLNIKRLKLPDVDDVEDIPNQKLQAIPDVLEWNDGYQDSAEAVSATVGELPWRSPTTQLIRAVDNADQRKSAFTQSASTTFDMRTVNPFNVRLSQDMLTNRMLIQHFGVPRLRIRVDDHLHTGQDYSLGQIVNIKDLPINRAAVINKNGQRVFNLEDNSNFYGYIVGRQFDFQTGTYELDIMLSGDTTVKWRAPSMMISNVDSGAKTLNADTFSRFGDDVPDCTRFNEGDEIQVWRRSGVLRTSEAATISDITNTTVTLSTWPFSTDPLVGDIVRIANLGQYFNDTVKTQTERAYAYLGAVAGTLPNGDDNDQIG